ncbi:MAG: hypothetical protein JW958_03210 [Candidatus Eisenbacteria bacterium]|nr:hypothetical protein [Candidatus Eisenbacteria bacterium]
MKVRSALTLGLALLVLAPSAAWSAGRGGRFGMGYSRYPVVGDMATLRVSSYKWMAEGGFAFYDYGSSQITFGGKVAVRPWEYNGIPVEMGGSFAIKTDGTFNDKFEPASLIELGFLIGFNTLVTENVEIGAGVYPLALGLGGAETAMYLFAPVFNIHFLF